MSALPVTYRCPWLVRHALHVVADGALVVEEGRIVAVAAGGAAERLVRDARGPVVEVDGGLAPGYVNAHTHLDLSLLCGRVDARQGFVPWIRALVRERTSAQRADLVRAARGAALAQLRAGVTTIGDIDTLGLSEEALRDSPQRVVLFREVLDGARPEGASRALEELDEVLRRPPIGRGQRVRGLSPHAPYSVSMALARGLGARRGARPIQVHWSESEVELEWLEQRRGAFAPLLGPPPARSGLALLNDAALLEGATLVHGNLPTPDEPARLAAAGVTLVHCPGTHAFFGRAPFPWHAFRAAGVTLALGTDSLASNDRLDMRAELARARLAFRDVDPRELLDAATRGGARALGLAGQVGELRPGAAADFVEVDARPGAAEGAAVADLLTRAEAPIARVWIDGALAAEGASD